MIGGVINRFETEVKTTRLNPINQRREPYVSGKQKVAEGEKWTFLTKCRQPNKFKPAFRSFG